MDTTAIVAYLSDFRLCDAVDWARQTVRRVTPESGRGQAWLIVQSSNGCDKNTHFLARRPARASVCHLARGFVATFDIVLKSIYTTRSSTFT